MLTTEEIRETRELLIELRGLRHFNKNILADLKDAAEKMATSLGMAPNDYRPPHDIARDIRSELLALSKLVGG